MCFMAFILYPKLSQLLRAGICRSVASLIPGKIHDQAFGDGFYLGKPSEQTHTLIPNAIQLYGNRLCKIQTISIRGWYLGMISNYIYLGLVSGYDFNLYLFGFGV